MFATIVLRVELAEEVGPNQYQSDSKPKETVFIGKYGPMVGEIRFAEGQLGNDEEYGGRTHHRERESLEKEPAFGGVDLDDEDPTRGSGGQEADDRENTQDLENDHAWAPGSLTKSEHDGRWGIW
jgi:hypothetical protein